MEVHSHSHPAAPAANGALPNTIIIGAPKCGTTSLHNYLDAHPSISMSRLKETDFFLDEGGTWELGLDWYKSHFEPSAPVRGEGSTKYACLPHSEGVAPRMKQTVPDAKLIYLVRDPFNRIASHYMHARAAGAENRPFDQAARDRGSRYLAASLYATQLEAFLEYFDRECVLVESQERLLADRGAALARIFGFLGVAPEVDRPEYERVWERSEGKGRAYRFAWHVAQRMQRHGIHLPDSLRWPAQRVLRSRLLGGGKPIPRPEVPEAVRVELSPLLIDEAQRLRALTGLELEDWSV
jgi:hypothetical protein